MLSTLRFLQSVSSVSPVVFGAFDIPSDRLLFSSAGEYLGYETNEKLDTISKIEQHIHPEDVDNYQEKFKTLLVSKPGEFVEFTFRLQDAEGNYRTLLIRDIRF